MRPIISWTFCLLLVNAHAFAATTPMDHRLQEDMETLIACEYRVSDSDLRSIPNYLPENIEEVKRGGTFH